MISSFHYPSKVFVEPYGYRKLIEESPVSFKRLMVIAGQKKMKEMGVLDEIKTICEKENVECLIQTGVQTNPTDVDIDQLCEQRKDFKADAILGIGGGSALDAAKLVAMQATNGGSCWDYINLTERPAKKIEKLSLPIIAIPTTSGTASESTPYAVMVHEESRMKKGVKSFEFYPQLVILDPYLLSLMPQKLIAVTGFDAFGQALEGYTSKKSHFYSEYFGWTALELIIQNLEKSWDQPENQEHKIKMAWGTLLSGLSFGSVDVNLAHAMSHPISAYYGLQHGLAVILCTFQAIQFNRDVVEEKYKRVAQLFPGGKASVDHLIESLHGWTEKFGIDLSLKNYEVPESDIDKLVVDALEIGAIKTNPKDVTADDLKKLYQKVWHGKIK